MSRRRQHQTFWSRRAAALARVWRSVAVRWRVANKFPWAFAVLASVMLVAFASLLHVVHAAKVQRQSLTCLALNVYFEARGEPKAGQLAVAEVTMNRVASGRYPDTVCGVVYQKNWDTIRKRYVSAFSWTEFKTRPEPRGEEWHQALQVAEEIYYRRQEPTLANALHYHADYIKPSWSRQQKPLAQIGNHVFYR